MLEGGHAVVADFGIARAVNAAGGERLTQTGMSVGTPMYMSPEQASGSDELDGRSDQYSLACVCYEMLAGQPPFTGPNAAAITRQHLIADAPPVTNLRSGVPPTAVAALTRALAKAPADRFASVAEFGAAMAGALTSGEAPVAAPLVPPAASRWASYLGAVMVLAAIAALGLWKRGATSTMNAGVNTASIAVLPFTDLSADHANAFLGDGIAETLINALANVPGLTVAARTSAFSFRAKTADLKELSRQLGVANVLEGSVQRAGEQLRITAQVVRIADGATLWSQRFDRAAADIFAVQDEVARSAIAALQIKLSAIVDTGASRAGTSNPAAYDAYLLGRYHWNRRTTDGMIRAAEAFTRAVALDSTYALAWTGLADTYVLSIPGEYNVPGVSRTEFLTRAERAARRAIALAPRLGEAYASLGETIWHFKRFSESRAARERGIALAPGYATGHQWYSYHLQGVNEWDAAVPEMEIAHRLDPLSHVITLSLAIVYDGADRFAEASPLYAQGFAQSPEAYYAWAAKIGHELALKHPDAAVDAFVRAAMNVPEVSGADSATVAQIAHGLRDQSAHAKAVDQLVSLGGGVAAASFFRWERGDDATVRMLVDQVRAGRGPGHTLAIYALLGPRLRSDPRIRAIAGQMGSPPDSGSVKP